MTRVGAHPGNWTMFFKSSVHRRSEGRSRDSQTSTNLGIRVEGDRTPRTISLSQAACTDSITKRFILSDSRHRLTPTHSFRRSNHHPPLTNLRTRPTSRTARVDRVCSSRNLTRYHICSHSILPVPPKSRPSPVGIGQAQYTLSQGNSGLEASARS